MNRFDVYTVAGGKANVTPTSLTILNDVPAAGRGMASRVTADATQRRHHLRAVGHADRDARPDLRHLPDGHGDLLGRNPNCATGVIHYSPGVTSNIGGDVTVVGVTNHTYQQIDTAVTAPSTVNPGETFKVRMAPAPGCDPEAPGLLGR